MKPIPDVAADFDRIAAALGSGHRLTRLTGAERAVVRAIPSTARSALDVGCGDGRVARAVAQRGLRVLAIDAAPQMVALARAWTEPTYTIEYQVADVMQLEASPAFDVVFSINMVHHVPLSLVIPQLAAFVAPAGRLVIQDVIMRRELRYLAQNVAAGVWQRAQGLIRSSRSARRVRHLYEQHGRDEVYLAPHAVAAALSPFLPGVAVTHHFGWRYTAVWNRPPADER